MNQTEWITPLTDALRSRLGADAVVTDAGPLAPYMKEWRGAFPGHGACVVRPASTAEVADALRIIGDYGGAVVPQGGNTGLVGGGSPRSAREVVLSLERMNRIRSVDPDDQSILVEAGCVLDEIHQAAAKVDRLFPLTLASESQCRIGGNLATNAGGLNVLRYGNTRDLTLGIEVVLADGRIWSELAGLRKDNSGLDLRNLFIGSEGTLGVITAARLKLYHRPRVQRCAWVPLNDLGEGLPLLRRSQAESGEGVSGCEVMSDFAVTLALKHKAGLQPPPEPASWHLLLEWSSSDLNADLDGAIRRALGGRPARVASRREEIEALWAVRRAIPGAQTAEGASLKHDLALPPGQLADFIHDALRRLAESAPAVRPCVFGHLGDGNLHFNISQPETAGGTASDAAEVLRERAAAIRGTLYDEVRRHGGSIAAEHGVGQLRQADMAQAADPVRQHLMRSIKQALDPENRLNPGKLYGTESVPPTQDVE